MNDMATPSADSSLPSVAPTLTGAYNRRVSGFGTSCLRPNSPFGRTSDTRNTLYDIPPRSLIKRFKTKFQLRRTYENDREC